VSFSPAGLTEVVLRTGQGGARFYADGTSVVAMCGGGDVLHNLPAGTEVPVACCACATTRRRRGSGAGFGLAGLRDRIEALGGRFVLHSPAGGGTTMSRELPVAAGSGLQETHGLWLTRT
jgi:hypothetical protein